MKKIINPILFQGNKKRKNYFEGWYFKQTSNDEKTIISLIPGISLFEGDQHSFMQYIIVYVDDENSNNIRTGYVRYSTDKFTCISDPFSISLGQSLFTEKEITLNLRDNDLLIEGSLGLDDFLPLKKSPFIPNIMGPFAYIPFMECYHGVISMSHNLKGYLFIDGKKIDFNNGKGYIEKDWGTSFPSDYVWLQSNHFKNNGASLLLSIAKIPFLKNSFTGFISNFVIDGHEFRFATYNGSSLEIHKISSQYVSITMKNSKAKLQVEAFLRNPGTLVAPVMGHMNKTIKEGLGGEVRIKLTDSKSMQVYEDFGRLAGIELVGNLDLK